MNKRLKVAWIINIKIPMLTNLMGIKSNNYGGWISGLLSDFIEYKDIELTIYSPSNNHESREYNHEGIKFILFPSYRKYHTKYSNKLQLFFTESFNNHCIDIVHCFGTEFPHTLAAINAFNRFQKTIIHIQGLVSIYAHHYFAGIDHRYLHSRTLIDLVKNKSLINQQNEFFIRGRYEVEALKKSKYICGRTYWDKAITSIYSPNSSYYFINESLRDIFYNSTWNIDNIKRHTIFVSQGNYPIKGLHHVLLALEIVKLRFPDVKLIVSGENILIKVKGILFKNTYAKYISRLIKKLDLKNNITFVGSLNSNQMKDEFLKAHVFVSPSEIENSPNSIGEAMLLGVPIVSSFVGGVPSIITHGYDAILYQSTAYYMLAKIIIDIFSDDQLAIKLSTNSKLTASSRYDRKRNSNDLYKLYLETMND